MQSSRVDYFIPKIEITETERILFYLADNDPLRAQQLWDVRYNYIMRTYYLRLTEKLNEMRSNLNSIKEMKQK